MDNEGYLELKYYGQLIQIEKENVDLFNEIISYMEKSDTVLVYRGYQFSEKENDTVLWIKKNAQVMYEVVDIYFELYDKLETISAENDEKIYRLDFNDMNRKEFFKEFKLASYPVKNLDIRYRNVDRILNNNQMFGDYNYICIKDEKVTMMIEGHTLDVLVCTLV